MQKAVGFDKEKCSCNICLTLVCSFINAKWSINQTGMVFRFCGGPAINLAPVLMKNGGERLCDSENVYITQEVIMACNGATHLPTCRRARPAHRPPGEGRSVPAGAVRVPGPSCSRHRAARSVGRASAAPGCFPDQEGGPARWGMSQGWCRWLRAVGVTHCRAGDRAPSPGCRAPLLRSG